MTVHSALGVIALTVSGQPLPEPLPHLGDVKLSLVSDYRWIARTGTVTPFTSNGAIVVSSAPFMLTPEIDHAMQNAVHAGLEHKYFL